MKIIFERLRDAGFHVDVTSDGVDIYGNEPMMFLQSIGPELRKRGFTELEADILLDEFAGRVMKTQIMKFID